MAHNIRPVAVGTMQHLSNHGIPIQSWSLSYSNREYHINRSETLSLVQTGEVAETTLLGEVDTHAGPSYSLHSEDNADCGPALVNGFAL